MKTYTGRMSADFLHFWNQTLLERINGTRNISKVILKEKGNCNQVPLSAMCTDEERIAYQYIVPTICITGILCNSLNLVVLTRKMLTGSAYTYLTALAMADLITSLVVFPIGLTRCGGSPDRTTWFYTKVYEYFILLPVNNTSGTISNWLVLVIGIERYIYVRFPVFGKIYCKPRVARKVILLICISAITLNLPYFCLYTIQKQCFVIRETGFKRSISSNVWSWSKAALVMFVPAITLVLLTFLLIYALRQTVLSRQRQRRQEGIIREDELRQRHRQSRHRLTVTLIAVVVLYLLGNLLIPFALPGVANYFWGADFRQQRSFKIYRMIANILVMTSFALNFVLYCIFNHRFVEVLRILISQIQSRTFLRNRRNTGELTLGEYNYTPTPAYSPTPLNSDQRNGNVTPLGGTYSVHQNKLAPPRLSFKMTPSRRSNSISSIQSKSDVWKPM